MTDKVVTAGKPDPRRDGPGIRSNPCDPTDTISDGGDSEGYKWPTIIKPIASGSMTIGGGTGGSGVKTGFDGSTSFGIKHLSDPHNPRDGSGWVIKAEKQIDIVEDVIKVVIKVGGDSGYISDTTGLISDTNIPKHEVPKNGDDQYDASGVWDKKPVTGDISDGGSQLGIILKVGGDDIGSTEYGGRTSEDIRWGGGEGAISDGSTWFGGEGLDVDGDFYIMDPTWMSGHTSTFSGDDDGAEELFALSGDWGTYTPKEKDFGVCGHTNSFSGDTTGL